MHLLFRRVYLRTKVYPMMPRPNAEAARHAPAPVYSSLSAALTAKTIPRNTTIVEPQNTIRLCCSHSHVSSFSTANSYYCTLSGLPYPYAEVLQRYESSFG